MTNSELQKIKWYSPSAFLRIKKKLEDEEKNLMVCPASNDSDDVCNSCYHMGIHEFDEENCGPDIIDDSIKIVPCPKCVPLYKDFLKKEDFDL